VEAGEKLARLDPTQTESLLGESAVKYRTALAKSIRLTAELENKPLEFPDSLHKYPDLIREETQLYHSRRARIQDILTSIDEAMDVFNKELATRNDLFESIAASSVALIRLERQMSDLRLKRIESETQYYVQAREELAEVNANVAAASSVLLGREDPLRRTTFY